MTTTEISVSEQAGELAGRLFESLIGMLELETIYLGVKLGLYTALASEPSTVDSLAVRTGLLPRYVKEWLEQQAVAGFVDVSPSGVYTLPPGHAEALTNPASPFAVAPLALLAGGAGQVMGAVLEAYRHGTGLSFGGYGDDVRAGQGGFNRAAFTYQLCSEWLPLIPSVASRLSAGPARVLDVGCGVGWSSIALATGYPGLTVDAIDSDEASIADARHNAATAGLTDRVRFEVADAALPSPGRYDAVFIFEALHDMAHPVAALRSFRGALTPGGSVIVMDERVADSFTAPGDPVERMFYAGSVLHCLPVGLSEPDSSATGAVMRPDTLRRYATEAGYSTVDVLPIPHDFFRFYHLVP